MTYALSFDLNLGSAGIADARAQFIDTTGANVGAAISTGFVDVGSGFYQWYYALFADTFVGGVKFYSNAFPAVILAFKAINPPDWKLTWDEVLTKATHNVAASSGRRLRQLSSNVILDGTAVSATSNTIVLDSGASSLDGAYDPGEIWIIAGTGAGQARLIYQYTGATKTAVVDRDWKITPDGSSDYVIVGNPGREHVNEGLARAATSTTLQLNALASSISGEYNGQILFIRSGMGQDQARRVLSYDGATKTATVDAWSTLPDATSAYVVLPTGMLEMSEIWSYASRTLTQNAATTAAQVAGSDIVLTRGDTLSAPLTGLGNLTSYTTLDFTVKVNQADPDTAAIVRIRKNLSATNDGLLTLNGAAATTAADGSITINDATLGNITVTLKAADTAQLAINDLVYDVQMITAAGVATLTSGVFSVVADVTRAVS